MPSGRETEGESERKREREMLCVAGAERGTDMTGSGGVDTVPLR